MRQPNRQTRHLEDVGAGLGQYISGRAMTVVGHFRKSREAHGTSAFPSEADIGRVSVGGCASYDRSVLRVDQPLRPTRPSDQYFCVNEHSILRKNLGHRVSIAF